ncbi:DNA-methyltransferase [Streptosporangium carneum]|uniref:DNA-methyltransferase n=1 Tax=Streptosporangium carneum TaxID=47481 RepID=UPI003CD062C0
MSQRLRPSGNQRQRSRHRPATDRPGPSDTAHLNGRNPGDVWTISTRPYPGAHYTPFPIDIPLRAIAAGCRPGGTVLDPFSGAATTALAARHLGRQFIGIELNEDYSRLAAARIRESSPTAGEAE